MYRNDDYFYVMLNTNNKIFILFQKSSKIIKISLVSIRKRKEIIHLYYILIVFI